MADYQHSDSYISDMSKMSKIIHEISDKSNNILNIIIQGATFSIGQGTGSLIAGYMTEQFGWKYYFYFIGTSYAICLILNLLFVHDSLEKYW